MADKRIIDFLIRAKKATYAGKGAEAASSRAQSHDLQYMEGALTYIDSYLGSAKFAGEEALWKDGVPFWSMNYVGRVLSSDFSGDFLKEALARVPEAYPFRGPPHYTDGGYAYACRVTGDFHWFQGYEEIHYQNRKVYECVFHGGEIE